MTSQTSRRALSSKGSAVWMADFNLMVAGLSRYGRSRVTALARFDGYPVGLMANDPRHGGGSTDVASGSKVMRLIQLCDTFHLPLVSFADEPGFMVGLESEK